MNKNGQFKTHCAYCGKEMWTYAKNKQMDLPVVYCSKKCEVNAKYDRRFDKRFQ